MSQDSDSNPIELSADELRAHMAAIIASSDDAIISKDLNGIIRSWNAGAERVFGYVASEIIGRSILIIIPEDRREEEVQILDRLRAGSGSIISRQFGCEKMAKRSISQSPFLRSKT